MNPIKMISLLVMPPTPPTCQSGNWHCCIALTCPGVSLKLRAKENPRVYLQELAHRARDTFGQFLERYRSVRRSLVPSHDLSGPLAVSRPLDTNHNRPIAQNA